jgi:hypothetical protein
MCVVLYLNKVIEPWDIASVRMQLLYGKGSFFHMLFQCPNDSTARILVQTSLCRKLKCPGNGNAIYPAILLAGSDQWPGFSLRTEPSGSHYQGHSPPPGCKVHSAGAVQLLGGIRSCLLLYKSSHWEDVRSIFWNLKELKTDCSWMGCRAGSM